MVKRPWLITGALALIGAVAIIGLAGLVYGLWEHSQLAAWRITHPGESSPYRTGKDFVNAHGGRFVWGKLTLVLLLGPYFNFYFRRKENRPVSTSLFTFFAACALGMLALGIADVLVIVKLTVWTSWDTARSLGPWYFYGPLYVFIALGFLLNLFLQRQSQWFGRELVNPIIFRAGRLLPRCRNPDSFAGRYLPEFLALREAFRRGQLLKRFLPGCGVIFGCSVFGHHRKPGLGVGRRHVRLGINERSRPLYANHRVGSGFPEASHHRELCFILTRQKGEELHHPTASLTSLIWPSSASVFYRRGFSFPRLQVSSADCPWRRSS